MNEISRKKILDELSTFTFSRRGLFFRANASTDGRTSGQTDGRTAKHRTNKHILIRSRSSQRRRLRLQLWKIAARRFESETASVEKWQASEKNSQTIRQQTIVANVMPLRPLGSSGDGTFPEYCVKHDAFKIIILLLLASWQATARPMKS